MLNALAEYRQSINAFLEQWLILKQHNFGSLNTISAQSVTKVISLVQKGKKIRASLIMHTMHMLEGKDDAAALRTGAAIELLHAALLIHDDIMDRDNFRRGLPTISYQYTKQAPNNTDAEHYGESLGICVGDMLYFFAFELLAEIQHKNIQQIIHKTAEELGKVAAAQMQDLHLSACEYPIDLSDILSVYKYKTARYTFSLPFAIGATLANADTLTIEKLEQLGEKCGILFQIKDDSLGLFSKESDIGKPVGTDIAENKKTIYMQYLTESVNQDEKQKLLQILGSPLESNSLRFVLTLMEKYAVNKKVAMFSDTLAKEAHAIINSLSLENEHKTFLKELLEYNLLRTK